MPNVLDIRRRIRSVINTRQITKAMKMVSAAKLRRAQDRALAARPYAQMLTNVLKSLVTRADIYDEKTGEPRHPLLVRRPENNILLIVVSGDKGLAGAFNGNILKAVGRFLATKSDKNIDIIAVGRKGRDVLRRRYPEGKPDQERKAKIQVVDELAGVLGNLKFADAKKVADAVVERYKNGEIDSVYLVYNEFKSVIAQKLVVDEMLPIAQIGAPDIKASEELPESERFRQIEAAASSGVRPTGHDTRAIDQRAAQFGTSQVDYIYEQSPDELFGALLPKYVAIQIYRAFMESVAAEHAARMTAMDSATNNATDMIDSLTLKMNRARQASITKEIIEIVSGAAAL